MFRRVSIVGFALAALGLAQQAISTRAGLVQRVEGHAQVSDVGPEGLPTDTFVHLEPGQRMRTLRGRAEVVLAPGAYVRFNAYSEIELVSASFSDIRVRLIEGQLLADLSEGKPGRDYNVSILFGDLVIQPERRGEYELVAREETPVEVRVHDGRARISSGDTSTRVGKGAELPVTPAGWTAQRELTIEDQFRFRLIDWSRRRRAELVRGLEQEPRWLEDAGLEELSLPPAAPTPPQAPPR